MRRVRLDRRGARAALRADRAGARCRRQLASGPRCRAGSLFDAFEASAPPPARPSAPRGHARGRAAEKLAFEKELLGFYVTGHPLDEYRPALESGKYTCRSHTLGEQEDKSTVTIAGALTSVEKKFTKKDGKPFAVVMLEDLTGSLEIMIWSEAFAEVRRS